MMREANAAGEREVQKVLKSMGTSSACTSTVSTPQVLLPHIVRNSPEGDIESLYLAEPHHKGGVVAVSTLALVDSCDRTAEDKHLSC